MLLNSPSGDLFGLTQNAGMGWNPAEVGRKQFLILSTQGGLRAPDGKPIALGYHTGHWEIGLLVAAAAEEFRRLKTIPFAGYCSDPCDGRTQGTTGMFDSLPYRNDAALIFRRLARSLPLRAGVLGIATCDKGLAGDDDGGGGVARFAVRGCAGRRDVAARERGRCRDGANARRTLCARVGVVVRSGGTGLSRVWVAGWRLPISGHGGDVAGRGEALGLSLPHSALAPSGQPVWLDMARRSARALHQLDERKLSMRDILTDASIENAMVLHAAFGGSTNLLSAHSGHCACGRIETADGGGLDRVNRRVPRLVSVLPNGPIHHPTVRVFLAGGVPEVMLHLRRLGLLKTDVLTVTGKTLGENLNGGKNPSGASGSENCCANWTASMRTK